MPPDTDFRVCFHIGDFPVLYVTQKHKNWSEKLICKCPRLYCDQIPETWFIELPIHDLNRVVLGTLSKNNFRIP